jgi:site-specific recombinase XerC
VNPKQTAVLFRRTYIFKDGTPSFGCKRLCNIKATDIERFLLHLREGKHLSNKSINIILGSFRIILQEACRQGKLSDNPAQNIKPLKNCFVRRGIYQRFELFLRLYINPN